MSKQGILNNILSWRLQFQYLLSSNSNTPVFSVNVSLTLNTVGHICLCDISSGIYLWSIFSQGFFLFPVFFWTSSELINSVCVWFSFSPGCLCCGSGPVLLQYLQGGRCCLLLIFTEGEVDAVVSSWERDEEEEEEDGNSGSLVLTSASLRSTCLTCSVLSSSSDFLKLAPRLGGTKHDEQ